MVELPFKPVMHSGRASGPSQSEEVVVRVTANPSLRPRLPGGPLVLRPCVGDFFSCLPLVLFGAGSRFRNRPLGLLPCRLSTALKKSSLYSIIHRPPQNNCLGYDSGTKKHIVGLLPVAQLSSQSSAVESLESGSRRHGLPRRRPALFGRGVGMHHPLHHPYLDPCAHS